MSEPPLGCIIVRSYDLTRDSRVRKLREAISGLYSDISCIEWDRDGSVRTTEKNEIVFRVKAPFGKQYLFFLPMWWLFLLKTSFAKKWDVAYVINWDSVIPMLIAAKIMNRSIVYDVQDTYEDALVLPELVRKILIGLDRALMKRCTAIALVDDLQKDEFGGIPNNTVAVIYDSPPDRFKGEVKSWSDDGRLIISFVGALYYERKLNIDKMIDAVLATDGVKLRIAGYGNMSSEILKLSGQYSDKIEYVGKVEFEKGLQMLRGSDATFVLRDPDLPIYRYISGSTMVNAMMCGLPLIVNDGTATAIKIKEKGCGIIVNASDMESIRKAIEELKDLKARERLGSNSRRAYEDSFGWPIMRNRLIDLHRSLLKR